MELLELLGRQPMVVPGELDETEVARPDDRDRRLVGRRRDLLLVEVDDAVGRPARQRGPGDGRADALGSG